MLSGIRHTVLLALWFTLISLVMACGGTPELPPISIPSPVSNPAPDIEATVESRFNEERAIEANVEAKAQAIAKPIVDATAQAVPTVTPKSPAIPTTTQVLPTLDALILEKLEPTLTPTTAAEEIVEGSTCILTGGEIVQKGWSGKDTGPNYCNQCRCLSVGLACTRMACPPAQLPAILTPTAIAITALTPTPTQVPPTSPMATIGFGPGIYYRQPFLDSYGAILTMVEELPLSTIQVMAFDISSETVVYANGDQLALVAPDGNVNSIHIPGLHQLDRPSFSPDGTKVVVQARESYTEPEDINIYIVDINTKKTVRISHLDVNEESPEWFSNKNKIAYTSFDPSSGLTVHIYDVDTDREIQTIKEAGYIHLAVSPDGTLIFNPVLARLYDVDTGKLVADLKDKILTALQDNGYTPDARFHGQANLGTFPMDADFSPDGKHIVLDGAVEKNGKYGLIIFSMTISGNNITPLTDIIEVNPTFSNDNNYSQLNPNWH